MEDMIKTLDTIEIESLYITVSVGGQMIITTELKSSNFIIEGSDLIITDAEFDNFTCHINMNGTVHSVEMEDGEFPAWEILSGDICYLISVFS